MSPGRIIILLAWMARRLLSSNSPMRSALADSCRAPKASPGTWYPPLCSGQSSRQVSGRVVCEWGVWWSSGAWISQSATVPGWNQHGLWIPLALGTCLSPHQSGACPWQTLPGPHGPFHFTFLACANCPRASHHFHSASLACCTLTRKVPGGVLLVEPHLGPLHSFLLSELLWVPFLSAGETWLPPHWVDSWCHWVSCGPFGRRFVSTTRRDALGMPDPVGTAGSFHLWVVCGEGIASLGVFGALSSFLRAPPAGPLGPIWTPLIIYGSEPLSCHSLPWTSFPAPKFQPALPTGCPHSSGCSLAQTLEARGGTSGTHGYTVLIKQPNGTALTKTARTQYSCRLLVPRGLKTHHCPPSYYCKNDPQIQKRKRILDPGHNGLWHPPDMGLYWAQSPAEAGPTHLRNREPGLTSGLWDPLAEMPTVSEKEWRHAPRNAPHNGLYPVSSPSLGWDSEAPISLGPWLWKLVIRVGTRKGTDGKLGCLHGHSPLGLEVNGVSSGKVILSIWGLSPPQPTLGSGDGRTTSLWQSGGFALPPAWPWLTDPTCGMGVTPGHLPSIVHGGI